MGVKVIKASKHPFPMPVEHLVRGDANTQLIRFIVKKNDGGVDLSNLVWSVWVRNSAGAAEVSYIGRAEVEGEWLVMDWKVIEAACSDPGRTVFRLYGERDGEGKTAWVSSDMIIEVLPNRVIDPYDSEDIAKVQQLILDFQHQIDSGKGAYVNATRNAMVAFISPSYGDEAYYPEEYALGISYDGVTFNEIKDTRNFMKDRAGEKFRGGGDVVITKVGDSYICVVNGNINLEAASDAYANDRLNKAVQYIVTKDFKNFSDVRIFDAYPIGSYIRNRYNGISVQQAASYQWEPSLFRDNDGNLYLTISCIYKQDEHYPDGCYYHNDDNVQIKYFQQLYMPVVFDESTQRLNAAPGGVIKEFVLPEGVESVIDVQVIPKGNGYYYLYKDRVTCSCNIAVMDSLNDKPRNIVSTLGGMTFAENPYMVEYDAYKLIYLTHYVNSGMPREGYVIKSNNDLSTFSMIPHSCNGDVMTSGTKNRSMHPIVISDRAILSYFENERGVIVGGHHDNTPNAVGLRNIDELAAFYGLPQTMDSNCVYIVSEDRRIVYDTRWTHDFNPVWFKRYNATNDINITMSPYGGTASIPVNLHHDGYIAGYSIGATQVLTEPHPFAVKTINRNFTQIEFYISDNGAEMHYIVSGTMTNPGGMASGQTVNLTDTPNQIPVQFKRPIVIPAFHGNKLAYIKIDPTQSPKTITFIYPDGADEGCEICGNGVLSLM